MKRKFLFVLLVLAFLAASCAPSQEQIDQMVQSAQETAMAQVTVVPAATQDVDQIVQATFQALTAQATATPMLIPNGRSDGTGSIAGNLSFPSEGIPPLYVVAFNAATGYYYWVATQQNQTAYQIDFLPPGVYHVVSYTQPHGPLVAGVYDQFYLCGMHQGCNNHSLVDVNVQAGYVTPNINPGDWYSGPENYPTLPQEIYAPQSDSATGSISGKLSYPSEGVPPLYVFAFSAANINLYYYVTTVQNQSTYQIDDLPPGNYYVVAYPVNTAGNGFSGGYSQAVPCGLAAQCTDHSLIPVSATGGQVTQDANPGDWYANPGTFPAFPLP